MHIKLGSKRTFVQEGMFWCDVFLTDIPINNQNNNGKESIKQQCDDLVPDDSLISQNSDIKLKKYR